jgi:hypothetical protein
MKLIVCFEYWVLIQLLRIEKLLMCENLRSIRSSSPESLPQYKSYTNRVFQINALTFNTEITFEIQE